MRPLLVQGVQHILGPFGVDCDLRRWGLKLAERGGKSGKKRAIIATPESWRYYYFTLWVEKRTSRCTTAVESQGRWQLKKILRKKEYES